MALILIVDDNESNRDIAMRYLEMKGFRTVLAKNGAEALQAVQVQRPDLIIMDLDMPVLSGWDAARMIKDEPKTNAIPILALTAHAMVEDRRRALRSGCDDYLSKPMDLKELLSKVNGLLAQAAGSSHS